MKIPRERYNGNTLRRYRFRNGAILAVNGRDCFCLPAFCNQISIPISRAEAAKALRGARYILKETP